MKLYKLFISIAISLMLLLSYSYAQDIPNSPIPEPLSPSYTPTYTPPPLSSYDEIKRGDSLLDLLKTRSSAPTEVSEGNDIPKLNFQTPDNSHAISSPVFHDARESERFRNSPCFYVLGYNPNQSYEIQDKKYTDCENSQEKSQLTKVGLISLLGIVIVIIIIVGLKKKPNAYPIPTEIPFTVMQRKKDQEYILSHKVYGSHIHMNSDDLYNPGDIFELDMTDYKIAEIEVQRSPNKITHEKWVLPK